MDKSVYFEHLDDAFSDNSSKDLGVDFYKFMSNIMKTARLNSKENKCVYCGKECSSFCNSHTIPRFCLENIGIEGNVKGPNSVMGLPYMGVSFGKETIGINSCGTFQIICRECDSNIFQDYETPGNYENGKEPTQKMLAEIAMKNYLKYISKRRLEIELYKEQAKMMAEKGLYNNYLKQKIDSGLFIGNLDLKTYMNNFTRAKKIAQKDGKGFYCVFYKLLDYVAPIAVQSPVTLIFDLDDKIVNNIFNYDPQYITTELHVCVFPLKTSTAVLMFIKDGETRYRNFYKQFRKKTEIEQLAIINYIVFLYCEDYFLADGIERSVDLDKLKSVSVKMPTVWSQNPITDPSILRKEFSLSLWESIPNLLSKEYKIR